MGGEVGGVGKGAGAEGAGVVVVGAQVVVVAVGTEEEGGARNPEVKGGRGIGPVRSIAARRIWVRAALRYVVV